MKKISLFDLDHTLLSVNCSFAFGAYLYKHRFFSSLTMLNLVRVYFLHKAGFLTLQALHNQIFTQIFLGKNADAVKILVKSFIDEKLASYLYQPAFKRLEIAKKNLDFTSILSNSPDFLVGPIASYFQVDDWKASIYEIDHQGCFSKISSFIEGTDKAFYLNSRLEIFKIVKENITAYSDSFLDLPFLKEAGTSVAVNPDRKLRRYSIENHWEIL